MTILYFLFLQTSKTSLFLLIYSRWTRFLFPEAIRKKFQTNPINTSTTQFLHLSPPLLLLLWSIAQFSPLPELDHLSSHRLKDWVSQRSLIKNSLSGSLLINIWTTLWFLSQQQVSPLCPPNPPFNFLRLQRKISQNRCLQNRCPFPLDPLKQAFTFTSTRKLLSMSQWPFHWQIQCSVPQTSFPWSLSNLATTDYLTLGTLFLSLPIHTFSWFLPSSWSFVLFLLFGCCLSGSSTAKPWLELSLLFLTYM